MWEGQATPRWSQKLAGTALALVSLPFFALGALGTWTSVTGAKADLSLLAVTLIALLVGLAGLAIAYRMFMARGVGDGGGVMSPSTYRVGGWAFLAMAAFFSYEAVAKSDYGDLGGVAASLFISFIFFVAARHRGAMRRIQ